MIAHHQRLQLMDLREEHEQLKDAVFDLRLKLLLVLQLWYYIPQEDF